MFDMAVCEREIAALAVPVRRHAGAPPLLVSLYIGLRFAAGPRDRDTKDAVADALLVLVNENESLRWRWLHDL